jgi:hypothetical protein
MMSMHMKVFTVVAFCGVAACAEMEPTAPEGASEEAAAEVDTATDAMNPLAEPPAARSGGSANLVGTGPIAYGAILADGTKFSGTANWSSTFNPTYNRYEITIAGESYYYLSYATVVTPAGDVRFCRTDSVSGRLLISCYDHAGNPATSRIGFVTSRP